MSFTIIASTILDTFYTTFLYQNEAEFALNLLYNVNFKQNGTSNVLFSPLTIYNLLIFICLASDGDTERSVRTSLGIRNMQSRKEILMGYNAYKKHKSHILQYDLIHAERLYLNSLVNVKSDFQQKFGEEIDHVEFSSPKTVDLINKWVANSTRNKITNIVTQRDFCQTTVFAMMSAAYFKGSWILPFSPNNTRKGFFSMSNSEKVQATMMLQLGVFMHGYSRELAASILDIPMNNDLRMLVILPFSTVDEVVNRLRIEVVSRIFRRETMTETLVEVALPKFEFEEEIDLLNILESIGFDSLLSNSPNLTRLTDYEGLTVSNIKHKAKIEVDESATDTKGIFEEAVVPQPSDPVKFYCNKPFVYLIYSQLEHIIFFAGIFNKP